ncbi:MAG: hypothetical protein IJ292_00135 [Clostridia bacterium]|nr:hypothetical protein [Clostridia bacterium]
MKKLFVIFLCLIVCLFAVACANNSKTDNNDKDDIDTSDVQNDDDKYVPGDDEDNSMFEYPKAPREYVVNYMRNMATIEWTPKTTFLLYGKYQAWKYNLTYKKGEKYYGLPFLVDSKGSMQEFLANVDNGVYVGGTSAHDCIGNACYDAVYMSLIQVCPSITFKSTEDMLPKNNTGFVAIGDWNSNLTKRDTSVIIENTSTEIMCKAYAQLRPGDVLMKHIVVQDAGHARIVSGKAHVEYTEYNTIDITKSYVTTIEQTNVWNNVSPVNTTWWVDRKITFSALLKDYFVPVRPVDYIETPDAPYIKADGLTSAEEIAEASSLSGTISSNHYIMKVEIIITNQDGKEMYNNTFYPNSKKVSLENVKYSPKNDQYENGTYKFTLKASLASGTKTLADYTFDINH